MHMFRAISTVGATVALLLLPSCSGRSVTVPVDMERPIIWPSPPSEPRIQFIRAFSMPEDLGITKGIWQRMSELFSGRHEPRLIRPMGIAVDSEHVVYVADPGAQAVHRFSLAEGRYDLIRREEGQPLPSPVAVAVAPGNNIIVADSVLGQLLVIRPGSKAALAIPLSAELERPTGVAVSPET